MSLISRQLPLQKLLLFAVLPLLSFFAQPVFAIDLALGPGVEAQEVKSGGIFLKRSWLGHRLSLDSQLNLEARWGSEDLSQKAIWFERNPNSFDIKDLFIEYNSEWMNFRGGYIPIIQSFETSLEPQQRPLPEGSFKKRRWFVEQDLGLEWSVKNQEWSGRWAVHNGEGSSNKDSNLWLSGMWRYQNSDGFGALLSAFVGRTSQESTSGVISGADSQGFIFDNQSDMKIRHAALAIFRDWTHHFWVAEVGKGEFFQNDQMQSYFWGHFDFVYRLGNGNSWLARYEQFQPNGRDRETQTQTYGLGFQREVSLQRQGRSSWQLWLQKNAQKNDIPDDFIELSYSIFLPSLL
jgi:hypothetical protein